MPKDDNDSVSEITPDLVAEHGLSEEEYQKDLLTAIPILRLSRRTPVDFYPMCRNAWICSLRKQSLKKKLPIIQAPTSNESIMIQLFIRPMGYNL